MVIDFKEIPEANKGGGEQDTFELFAREFLLELGFKILEGPDRGSDGGRDIIVEEVRTGIVGTTTVRWLVSCKHLAHSSKSVSLSVEQDICDRVKQHKCNAFMGFYSTIQSSGLSKKLTSFTEYETDVYDSQKIERILLSTPEWYNLAKRFFPISLKQYLIENPKPAKIFSDEPSILCDHCKQDLLKTGSGLIGFIEKSVEFDPTDWTLTPSHDLYFSCYGQCGMVLRSKYSRAGNIANGWCDIFEFTNPFIYIDKLKAFIKEMGENQYKGDAIEKMKILFATMFPYISRELSSDEKKEADKYWEWQELMPW